MKLDEIARLAGVSRTTASYVINGKAKQYRVSDKTVEKVMVVVREHNFQPNAVAAGLRAGKTRSIGLVIPDLENISYTRIANYLERQARQCGYQLLIACSEDQPDNEISCVEHLLQRKVDALIVSTVLPPDHPFYQRLADRAIPVIALDRALDPDRFVSVVGSDQEDAQMLAAELRTFAVESVLYIGALPKLSVSQLREQGFKAAWQGDDRQIDYLYANSYEREAGKSLFSDWLKTNKLPKALFTTSFAIAQGVIDVILQLKGRLPIDMVIATFGDNELLDFLECPVLTVAQRHREVAERVLALSLASLNESTRPKMGLTYIRRDLFKRGSLSRV